jgi:hypothetical protein
VREAIPMCGDLLACREVSSAAMGSYPVTAPCWHSETPTAWEVSLGFPSAMTQSRHISLNGLKEMFSPANLWR